MKQTDRRTATNPTTQPARALVLGLCILFTQAACAEENSGTASAVNGAVNAAESATTAPAEETAPKLSAGMQIPVDGTSVESFEASLAEIKSKATEEEYVSLDGAIKYLLVYDLSAKRDKAKLAANLNGLTGEEIVNRVKW